MCEGDSPRIGGTFLPAVVPRSFTVAVVPPCSSFTTQRRKPPWPKCSREKSVAVNKPQQAIFGPNLALRLATVGLEILRLNGLLQPPDARYPRPHPVQSPPVFNPSTAHRTPRVAAAKTCCVTHEVAPGTGSADFRDPPRAYFDHELRGSDDTDRAPTDRNAAGRDLGRLGRP